jgi:hypothetical protein
MPKKSALPSAVLNRALIGQRLVALLVLGWLLFNYPLLALFNDAASWCGIPLLVAYLFGAWALFIALLALTVERAPKNPRPDCAEG